MSPDMASAGARSVGNELRHMLRHGLITAVFSCAIAAALSVTDGSQWTPHLVYSLSIGLLSWLFIDTGRLLATWHREVRWPPGPWGWVIGAVGATLGFLGGNLVGDAWVGAPAFDFLDLSGRKLATGAMVTLTATVGLCFFFYSLGRSRHLQGQVDQAQRAATEARLKLLETQLEPHMLFNTLANLRVLVTLDPPRAVAMLDRLDRYLRMTLCGARAPMHPLAAEFDRLDDYLGLMAVRMDERLRYVLTLPEALRDVPVPPMLLQPLVENAICHGLEPRIEGGRIDVRACREGERLVVEVIDTGVGLDVEAPCAGDGFGLAQVRERLAAVYGDRARLDLAALPGDDGGARATLSVPLPERH